MAKLLHLTDGAHLCKMENGKRPISGPAQVLMTAIMESQAVRDHFGLTLRDTDKP